MQKFLYSKKVVFSLLRDILLRRIVLNLKLLMCPLGSDDSVLAEFIL